MKSRIPPSLFPVGSPSRLRRPTRKAGKSRERATAPPDERSDQLGLLTQTIDRKVELLVQFFEITAHDLAHRDVFAVVPTAFVPRVQIRGVARHQRLAQRSVVLPGVVEHGVEPLATTAAGVLDARCMAASAIGSLSAAQNFRRF